MQTGKLAGDATSPMAMRRFAAVDDQIRSLAAQRLDLNCSRCGYGIVSREPSQQAAHVVAEREHLKGKPAPDTFLAGARALGVAPAQAAVFEDALAGVAAGRNGGFAYVVGVDRVGQAGALREHGADIVVTDLAELLDR